MARKNTTAKTSGHINREMSSDTYKLRRQVMQHVYEAKALVGGSLPRVEIRITDNARENVLGSARMGDCVVWITAKAVARKDLRAVVFHELLHAVYAVDHVADCPLMAPAIQRTTKAQQDRLFKKYAAA